VFLRVRSCTKAAAAAPTDKTTYTWAFLSAYCFLPSGQITLHVQRAQLTRVYIPGDFFSAAAVYNGGDEGKQFKTRESEDEDLMRYFSAF